MRHRAARMAAFPVVLLAPGALFVIVPKGFIPDQDTDQIAITTEAAQGNSYDKLVEYQGQVSDIIRQNPNVVALVSTIGGKPGNTLRRPYPRENIVTLKTPGRRAGLLRDTRTALPP